MTQPQIDAAALARLERIGGAPLVAEMIDLFLQDAPRRIAAAQQAQQQGDAAALLRAAHSLKSSCANVGLMGLRQLAAEIERLAGAGQSAAAAPLLRELGAAFEAAREPLAARRPAAAGPRRIAVVEDNADNRLLVRALLRERYQIEEYENGLEALSAFRQRPPDLVLLDVSLPGLDGHEVLRALRADAGLKTLPVIALTAHAMAGDREQFLSEGFDDYVAKPIVDEQELLTAIERALARGAQRKEQAPGRP